MVYTFLKLIKRIVVIYLILKPKKKKKNAMLISLYYITIYMQIK